MRFHHTATARTHARDPRHARPPPHLFIPRSKLWYTYNVLHDIAWVAVPAIVAAFYTTNFWVRMACALGVAIGFQQFGWTAHEFAHHQVFQNRFYNNLVLWVCCLGLGFDRDW